MGILTLYLGFYCNGSGCIFPFYGLTLLKNKIEAKVAPQTNPAMPMPNLLMGNMPGFETVATSLMKKTSKNKGVATIEELRSICQDTGVKLTR